MKTLTIRGGQRRPLPNITAQRVPYRGTFPSSPPPPHPTLAITDGATCGLSCGYSQPHVKNGRCSSITYLPVGGCMAFGVVD